MKPVISECLCHRSVSKNMEWGFIDVVLSLVFSDLTVGLRLTELETMPKSYFFLM